MLLLFLRVDDRRISTSSKLLHEMADVTDLLVLYEARRLDEVDNIDDDDDMLALSGDFFSLGWLDNDVLVVFPGAATLAEALLSLDDLRSSVSSKLLDDKLVVFALLLLTEAEWDGRRALLLLLLTPLPSKEDERVTTPCTEPVLLRDRLPDFAVFCC